VRQGHVRRPRVEAFAQQAAPAVQVSLGPRHALLQAVALRLDVHGPALEAPHQQHELAFDGASLSAPALCLWGWVGGWVLRGRTTVGRAQVRLAPTTLHPPPAASSSSSSKQQQHRTNSSTSNHHQSIIITNPT
jgi:hypothetical protein